MCSCQAHYARSAWACKWSQYRLFRRSTGGGHLCAYTSGSRESLFHIIPADLLTSGDWLKFYLIRNGTVHFEDHQALNLKAGCTTWGLYYLRNILFDRQASGCWPRMEDLSWIPRWVSQQLLICAQDIPIDEMVIILDLYQFHKLWVS